MWFPFSAGRSIPCLLLSKEISQELSGHQNQWLSERLARNLKGKDKNV